MERTKNTSKDSLGNWDKTSPTNLTTCCIAIKARALTAKVHRRTLQRSLVQEGNNCYCVQRGMAKVERIMIVWFLITLLVGIGIGYSFTYLIYQPQIQTLQNGLDRISDNLNVLTANTNAFLEAMNSTLEGIKLTLGATNSTF
jgi:hypothetical protein